MDVLEFTEKGSPEERQVLDIVEGGYLYQKKSNWEVGKVARVYNDNLMEIFQSKKQEMIAEGCSQWQTEEWYAFSIEKKSVATKICTYGLKSRQSNLNGGKYLLGDPTKGVTVYKYSDVCQGWAEIQRYSEPIYMVVYKIMLGRAKYVDVNPGWTSLDLVQPTLGYHSHIPKIKPSCNDRLQDAVNKSRIYLYEFCEQKGFSSCPSHCVPVALVEFWQSSKTEAAKATLQRSRSWDNSLPFNKKMPGNKHKRQGSEETDQLSRFGRRIIEKVNTKKADLVKKEFSDTSRCVWKKKTNVVAEQKLSISNEVSESHKKTQEENGRELSHFVELSHFYQVVKSKISKKKQKNKDQNANANESSVKSEKKKRRRRKSKRDAEQNSNLVSSTTEIEEMRKKEISEEQPSEVNNNSMNTSPCQKLPNVPNTGIKRKMFRSLSERFATVHQECEEAESNAAFLASLNKKFGDTSGLLPAKVAKLHPENTLEQRKNKVQRINKNEDVFYDTGTSLKQADTQNFHNVDKKGAVDVQSAQNLPNISLPDQVSAQIHSKDSKNVVPGHSKDGIKDVKGTIGSVQGKKQPYAECLKMAKPVDQEGQNLAHKVGVSRHLFSDRQGKELGDTHGKSLHQTCGQNQGTGFTKRRKKSRCRSQTVDVFSRSHQEALKAEEDQMFEWEMSLYTSNTRFDRKPLHIRSVSSNGHVSSQGQTDLELRSKGPTAPSPSTYMAEQRRDFEEPPVKNFDWTSNMYHPPTSRHTPPDTSERCLVTKFPKEPEIIVNHGLQTPSKPKHVPMAETSRQYSAYCPPPTSKLERSQKDLEAPERRNYPGLHTPPLVNNKSDDSLVMLEHAGKHSGLRMPPSPRAGPSQSSLMGQYGGLRKPPGCSDQLSGGPRKRTAPRYEVPEQIFNHETIVHRTDPRNVAWGQISNPESTVKPNACEVNYGGSESTIGLLLEQKKNAKSEADLAAIQTTINILLSSLQEGMQEEAHTGDNTNLEVVDMEISGSESVSLGYDNQSNLHQISSPVLGNGGNQQEDKNPSRLFSKKSCTTSGVNPSLQIGNLKEKEGTAVRRTAPETAGQFHGRTLLRGKEVPPRYIPLKAKGECKLADPRAEVYPQREKWIPPNYPKKSEVFSDEVNTSDAKCGKVDSETLSNKESDKEPRSGSDLMKFLMNALLGKKAIPKSDPESKIPNDAVTTTVLQFPGENNQESTAINDDKQLSSSKCDQKEWKAEERFISTLQQGKKPFQSCCESEEMIIDYCGQDVGLPPNPQMSFFGRENELFSMLSDRNTDEQKYLGTDVPHRKKCGESPTPKGQKIQTVVTSTKCLTQQPNSCGIAGQEKLSEFASEAKSSAGFSGESKVPLKKSSTEPKTWRQLENVALLNVGTCQSSFYEVDYERQTAFPSYCQVVHRDLPGMDVCQRPVTMHMQYSHNERPLAPSYDDAILSYHYT
ncbi:uncharacterized protein LOC106171419 [Lingula anatina]|uniref:Uncharacterized protein LOC106171419 n=1 Tax=Lingula anatina TaxID=7574 RepID=A0A1S3J9Y6_LINAN|nr:uncharacterized protein LOC106171419 [Lingula anatina]|eukprot:XP_013407217.1 uncharacterized protein LOC106171419 [Lingula anatina]